MMSEDRDVAAIRTAFLPGATIAAWSEAEDALDRLAARLAAAERDRDRYRAALERLAEFAGLARAALTTPEGKPEDE